MIKSKLKKLLLVVIILAVVFSGRSFSFVNIKDVFAEELSSTEEESSSVVEEETEAESDTVDIVESEEETETIETIAEEETSESLDESAETSLVEESEETKETESTSVSEEVNTTYETATIDDGTITLNDDMVLEDTLYIENDTVLNLNSFSLSLEKDDYVIYVKNSILTIVDETGKGSVIGSSSKAAIYVENSDLYLNGGTIKALKSDVTDLENDYTIEAYNSNVTIDGSEIYGREGADEEFGCGSTGGAAIYFKTTKNNKKIYANKGLIKGGEGGNGTIGKLANGGEGIFVHGEEYSDYEKVFRGGDGNEGCGDGGYAIILDGKKADYTNLKIEDDIKIYGGNGGVKTSISNNNGLFKETTLPSSYDLRNEGVITPLVSQKQTGLCNTFANMAMAETKMLMTYPEWSATHTNPSNNRLDFSETGSAYFMRFHPSDPLGNAGPSSDEIKSTTNYKKIGSGHRDYAVFYSTWRGVQFEDTVPFNNGEPSDTFDESLGRQNVIYGTNQRYYTITNKNRTADIEKLKKAVYEHGPCVISINHHSTKASYSQLYKDSANGDARALYVPVDDDAADEADGVHAITVIGWDDNYPASNFSSKNQPPADGAFLCKNSHKVWNWLSYYHNFEDGNNYFYYADYVPAENYDNLYYYDGGTYTNANITSYDSMAVLFEAKKDREEVKAASFMHGKSLSNKVNVEVFKISSEDTKNSSNKNVNTFTKVEGSKTISKEVDVYNGIVFVEFDDTLELSKGEKFVIRITANGEKLSMPADKENNNNFNNNFCNNHTTISNKSYYKSGNDYIATDTHNYRLKVITNNLDPIEEESTEQSTEQSSEGTTESSTEQSEEESTAAPEESSTEQIEEESTAESTETSVEETTESSREETTTKKNEESKGNIVPEENSYSGKSSGSSSSSSSGSTGSSYEYSSNLEISPGGQLVFKNKRNLLDVMQQQQKNSTNKETFIPVPLSVAYNSQLLENNATAKWELDTMTNKWKLNVFNDYQSLELKNSYFVSDDQSVYCFDANGDMVTGWLKDSTNHWRYFSEEKNQDEGKMLVGWQNIGGYIYCFDPSGSLYINTVTPEGYIIDKDGRLVL